MSLAPSQACPCGRTDGHGRVLAFEACCGRCLDQNVPAPDAESLMRSRYSAFVLGRRDHLLSTWHVSTRPSGLVLDAGVKWLGLEVRTRRTLDADHAEVEFVARSRVAGKGQRLHEHSRFVRENGRWFYVDGELE